jgi:thiamine-monophosphate kinase
LLEAGLARSGELAESSGIAGSAGFEGLVAAHLRPMPPYDAGPEAADLGATAMIDISDGLVADLGHIASASGVRIDIRAAALELGGPLSEAARALGSRAENSISRTDRGDSRMPPDSLTWALSGGEDHSLVATFPPGVRLPPRWTVIAEVQAGQGIRVDGQAYVAPGGWDHFR